MGFTRKDNRDNVAKIWRAYSEAATLQRPKEGCSGSKTFWGADQPLYPLSKNLFETDQPLYPASRNLFGTDQPLYPASQRFFEVEPTVFNS